MWDAFCLRYVSERAAPRRTVTESIRAVSMSLSRVRAHPSTLPSCFLEELLSSVITPWPLVRKRSIPTERPPLVGEIRGVAWSARRNPHGR
jgi:hypothetical protein